jgi:hypothetical protein
MGLDQYVFKRNKDADDEKVAYWRKNYSLNEWACNNWCDESISDFNCEELDLTEKSIDDIINYIIYNLDKSNNGQSYDKLFSSETIAKLVLCKERIQKGDELYYYAWW